DEHMLPETLKTMGYQTAMVGKWHLGHAHRRMFPNARGFDHFYGCVNAEIDYFEHTKQGGLDWQRNGKGVRESGYATDLLAAEAVKVIRERKKSQPLFLYAAFTAVHAPLQAPPELLAKYANIQSKPKQAMAAMVDSLDQAVGRILEIIDREGMARDTLLLFLSDNGGAAASVNLPYRAGKLTVFEGGIRVPCLMRWPGKIRPGSSVDQIMSVLDLLPTLAKAAGGKPGSLKSLDGLDLLDQVTGAPPVRRKPLFWACKRNETPDYQYAVRVDDWKLVLQVFAGKPSPPDLLFGLAHDPFEKTDLAAQNPERVVSLGAELDLWKSFHPAAEIQSSMTPHPGWIPPKDYAQAPDYDS
ncbi:MAG: sulfatase-like hydrolase/transferase, partial [Verrucomicrobiota bacterium]